MKSFAKLFTVAALVVGVNAHTADGVRKEAVLEGRYLHIVASAPFEEPINRNYA